MRRRSRILAGKQALAISTSASFAPTPIEIDYLSAQARTTTPITLTESWKVDMGFRIVALLSIALYTSGLVVFVVARILVNRKRKIERDQRVSQVL